MRNRGWLKAQKNQTSQHHENGYVLPLVVVSGMILILGAVVLSTRSFNSLMGAILQNQGHQAEEIAESGLSILLKELNNQFPYLLTVGCRVENNSPDQQLEAPECAGWRDFEFGAYGGPAQACDGRSTSPRQIEDFLSQPVAEGKGLYRLRNYEFLGDQIQGGTAIIQVQGLRLKGPEDDPQIASSAIIEQEVTVVPKCCNRAPYEPCGPAGSGWSYSLLTQDITLNVGDVIDEKRPSALSGANVHCVNCDQPPADKCEGWTSADQTISNDCSSVASAINNDQLSQKERSELLQDQLIGSGIIDGARSAGDIDIPAAPTWHDIRDENGNELSENLKNLAPWDMRYRSITIGHNTHPNHCVTITNKTTNKKTTHCRILRINQTGTTTMTLKPKDGDIRFYMEGQQINLSGNNFVNTGNFGQFVIYGGISTYKTANINYADYGCGNKQLNLSGGGSINAFLFMPCFDVNLSGGNSTYPITITGSVIAKNYEVTGDYARLIVPTDAGKTICETYQVCGGSSGEGQKEFAALGSNRWRLIKMQRE